MSFPFDFATSGGGEGGGSSGQIRTREERDGDGGDCDRDEELEDLGMASAAPGGAEISVRLRKVKVRAPTKRLKLTEAEEAAAKMLIPTLRRSEELHLQQFNENVMKLLSSSTDEHIAASCFFRNILSSERHDPISSVLNMGVAKRLSELLKTTTNQKLIEEILWCMTNIACGQKHQTRIFFDEGLIPLMIGMIGSPPVEIAEQAMVSCIHVINNRMLCMHIKYLLAPLTPVDNLFNSGYSATWQQMQKYLNTCSRRRRCFPRCCGA